MEKVGQSCKNFSILSQDAQLIWLMNNESEVIINLFSRYIYDCFKLKDDFTKCICLITKGLSILVLGKKSLTRCICIFLINDELFTAV